jgi:hypothetical protein
MDRRRQAHWQYIRSSTHRIAHGERGVKVAAGKGGRQAIVDHLEIVVVVAVNALEEPAGVSPWGSQKSENQ